MLTMYFCYDDHDPVIRCWPAVPRIGDTVALAEFEDDEDGSLKVTDVVWEGDQEPTLSIYLKRSKGLLRRFVKSTSAPTPCIGNSGS
ncbi:MAG: hypothetical protein WD738_00995 [Pirellulales bacterium]